MTVAEDDDLGAGRYRVACHPAAHERVRAPGFDHPFFDRAVVALDVQMNERVRIDPFDTGDGAP